MVPSRNNTLSSAPLTRGRSSTVCTASTLPVNVLSSGMLRCSAATTPTLGAIASVVDFACVAHAAVNITAIPTSKLRISSSLSFSCMCFFDAGIAGSLQSGVDDAEQSRRVPVDGHEDDALALLPQPVRPVAEPIDRQAEFREARGITDHHVVSLSGAARQCEQFVLAAAVERHNRNERWFQHGSKIAVRLRR